MSLKSYHTWVAVLTGVAMIWVVPAALLMAFGHRPEVPMVDPVVSSTTACVMFCAPSQSAAATPSTAAPVCKFLCDEPPLPTPGELCRLFCELGQG
ncbi:hypothetical protein [Nocardia sp. NPDC056000]|uniref:hypothetical protein n=1 Tax=Nocardia sp. NPDC056000 TaxID=3345674 RepID=UPI0035DFB084